MLTRKAAESALGYPLTSLFDANASLGMTPLEGDKEQKKARWKEPKMNIGDLLLGQVVGTGQFGMVRIARLKGRSDLYALKVIHVLPRQRAMSKITLILDASWESQDADAACMANGVKTCSTLPSAYWMFGWRTLAPA